MSKLGVISDIHGNYPALKSVIDELVRHGVNDIICLGDIAGYYSMLNECIELIIQNNIRCLKGNHDSYILGEACCPRSNSVNRCIDYQKSVIKTEYLEWIQGLSSLYESKYYVAMHGGFENTLDQYVDKFDFIMAARLYPKIKIFMSGHTHKQIMQEDNGIIYFNPGSVGQPRDYDPRAAFAIINGNDVELHRVEYPIDIIASNMEQAGFNSYFYENLYLGCKIGERR